MKEVDDWVRDHTGGQVTAILSKVCGGDVSKLDAVRRGELGVELKKIIQKLFDKNGCRRPHIPNKLNASVCDANPDFRLNQPQITQEIDFANRLLRLQGKLQMDFSITAEQFKQEIERLLYIINDNPQIANITNGVYLPLIMPKLVTDDIGEILEEYLDATGKSYINVFPGRKFNNYRKGELAGQVSIVKGSRHDRIIEKMKQGPVIGIYFPNSLQGFSVNAQREQIVTLPEGFILSGLDIAIATAMYPNIMAQGYNTPGYTLSAFSWRSVDYSLLFWAYAGKLDFDITNGLVSTFGNYSGGLFFYGWY